MNFFTVIKCNNMVETLCFKVFKEEHSFTAATHKQKMKCIAEI